MKKKLTLIVSLLAACGIANAVLLVHEDFEGMSLGANPGSVSSSDVGLGITDWANALGSSGSASVTAAMSFGSYVTGEKSLQVTKTSSGGSVSFDTSTAGISSGKMYVSFLFNGSAADLATASYMQFRRSGNLDFRINPLATGTSDNGIGFAYGGTTYHEDNSGSLMNTGTNYMMIAKFDGLGTAGGTVSGWAVSAEAFDSISSGGITEAELDAVAYLKASGTDTETLTLAATDTFLFAFGGAAEYTIDEIRIATTLADAVGLELTSGLLIHEDFEDMIPGSNPGTAALSECGTGITDWANSLGSNGDAWITNAVSFDTYSTGDNAMYVTNYSGGGSLTFTTSTDGIDTNTMYVSMIFNGSAADLDAASFMQMRRITGSLDFRVCPLATGTTDHGLGIAYGGTTYKEDNSDTLMNNGSFLIVAKFDGLGSAGGEATIWAINSTVFYNNKRDGFTEAELNANAFLQVTGTDSELLTLGADDLFTLAFGGPSAYVIDEIKIGTSLESVTVPLTTTGPLISSIVGLNFVSDDIVEMTVFSSSPVENYLLVSSNLVTDTWQTVAHSDDGVNDFVVTNLSYSTVSGTNRVIYLQADTAQKFFGIGGE